MNFKYKRSENISKNSSKRMTNSIKHEKFGESEKCFLEIDDDTLNCFNNIIIAYKTGNTIRLLSRLKYLNNITTKYYFELNTEYFNLNSDSISNILMLIAFDKSSEFSLKCIDCALSIIENLTFDDQYGFVDLFYELGIINKAYISLFSEYFQKNLNLIIYSLRILINYSEFKKEYAEELILNCPLHHFIEFILNINDDDEILEKKVKNYSVWFLCVLSYASSDNFTHLFYASVDFLLRHSPFFQKKYNIEKYIFLISINCINSDEKCADQFVENANLINLIIDTVNNQNIELFNFRCALILLDKLYQKFDFIIEEIDIANLICYITLFESDDLLSLLRILSKYFKMPQFSTFALDSTLISILSQIFSDSNFAIKKEVIVIFCEIIENSPLDFLPCLIYENIIKMIFEMYDSDDNDLKNILLETLIKLFDSFYYFNQKVRSFFASEIDEIDFSVFDEEDVNESDETKTQLLSHLKELYDSFYEYHFY